MTKYVVDKEFGEAVSCDNIYLGKIKPTSNANRGFVTIEKYMGNLQSMLTTMAMSLQTRKMSKHRK